MEATVKPSGAKIRYLRKRRGLTQVELAKQAGIGPITVSHVENETRNASPTTVTKLAAALGVEPSELWDD